MNERQVSNKALELANWLVNGEVEEIDLQESAAMLRSQEAYINKLHKLCNLNGLGAGIDLLTGEVIPFEVNE